MYKYKIGDKIKIKEKLLPDDFDIVNGYSVGRIFMGNEYIIWKRKRVKGENCYCLASEDKKWSYDFMDMFLWQEKALCYNESVRIDW